MRGRDAPRLRLPRLQGLPSVPPDGYFHALPKPPCVASRGFQGPGGPRLPPTRAPVTSPTRACDRPSIASQTIQAFSPRLEPFSYRWFQSLEMLPLTAQSKVAPLRSQRYSCTRVPFFPRAGTHLQIILFV